MRNDDQRSSGEAGFYLITGIGKISRLGTLAILSTPLIEGIVNERQPNLGEEGLKAAIYSTSC